jgi:hypothetical protein
MSVYQLNSIPPDQPHEAGHVPEAPWDASLVECQRDEGARYPAGEGIRRIPDPVAPGREFVSKGGGVDLCSSHFQLREGHEYVHSARQ